MRVAEASELVRGKVSGGYVTEDGRILYPVIGGIARLLPDSGIRLEPGP